VGLSSPLSHKEQKVCYDFRSDEGLVYKVESEERLGAEASQKHVVARVFASSLGIETMQLMCRRRA
jgi:hypothetical protein